MKKNKIQKNLNKISQKRMIYKNLNKTAMTKMLEKNLTKKMKKRAQKILLNFFRIFVML